MPEEKWITAIVTVLLGIIGVAVLTVLVSKNSNTSGVITSTSGGFACTLKTAITGNNECSGLTDSVTSIFRPL